MDLKSPSACPEPSNTNWPPCSTVRYTACRIKWMPCISNICHLKALIDSAAGTEQRARTYTRLRASDKPITNAWPESLHHRLEQMQYCGPAHLLWHQPRDAGHQRLVRIL